MKFYSWVRWNGCLLFLLFSWNYAQDNNSVSASSQPNRLAGQIVSNQISPLSTVDDGLSNQVYLLPSSTNFSHLERYRLNTQDHWLRRSEITFFISIPFTILWSTFLIDRFSDLSVVGAFLHGIRDSDVPRGQRLKSGNFFYYHDTFPSKVVDPFYLFKWISSTLWPLVIAANDFTERGWHPDQLDDFKKDLKNNRFELNLINQLSF